MSNRTEPTLIFPPVWIVAFTGHRPKPDILGRSAEEIAACRPELEKALVELNKRAVREGGEIHLFSSLAEGADCLAVETALDLGLVVHLVLPLPLDDFTEDFSSESPARSEMRRLFERVRKGRSNTVRICSGSGLRPDCYTDASNAMLEVADALVAINVEKVADADGGASDVISQASAMKLPIIVINPADRSTCSERIEEFAGSEDDGLRLMRELSGEADPQDPNTQIGPMEKLDQLADHSSRISKRRKVVAILCSSLATLTAAFIASFTLFSGLDFGNVSLLMGLTSFELALVIAALLFRGGRRAQRLQRLWVRARVGCEILRSLGSTRGILEPLNPTIAKHDGTWRRFALSAALSDPGSESDPFHLRSNSYLSERIEDQLTYYREKLVTAARVTNRLDFVARLATLLSVPFVGAALTLRWIDSATGTELSGGGSILSALSTQFLPIALPLIAATAASLVQILDASRRVGRYWEMTNDLAVAFCRIPHLHTQYSIRSMIEEIEDTLANELIEWQNSSGGAGWKSLSKRSGIQIDEKRIV